MNHIPIHTAQNVKIHATLATVGDRILAFIIDLVIKLIYIYGLSFIGLSKSMEELYSDDWSVMATQIIFFLPITFYTLYSEVFSGGYTIGKKIMKVKVISLDSYKMSFYQYFIRWIFNLVDIFILFGSIGVLSTVFSSKNQRIGDLSAGTTVVKVVNNTSINDSIFMEVSKGYKVTFPMVSLLSDRDVQIIKSSFYKSKENGDYKTIQLIRSKINQILNVQSTLNDFDFIERVLEDYNFVTKDMV